MDIDMSALRGLVREKEISFDLLVEAIEAALLIAYHRTEGSHGPQRTRVSSRHRLDDSQRRDALRLGMRACRSMAMMASSSTSSGRPKPPYSFGMVRAK